MLNFMGSQLCLEAFQQPVMEPPETEENKNTFGSKNSSAWEVKDGGYGGSSFSAVANTSHCKSQAGSREPQRVLCTRRSVQEDSQSPLLLHTANHPPPCLCSLKKKKSTAIHLVIKNQNSGVLSSPLLLLNSGSVDGAADASPFSNKVHSKNLERLCGGCTVDANCTVPK